MISLELTEKEVKFLIGAITVTTESLKEALKEDCPAPPDEEQMIMVDMLKAAATLTKKLEPLINVFKQGGKQ